MLGVDERQCHFRATQSGAEIDLLVQRGGRLRGFEVRRTNAPAATRSIRTAVDDLDLRSLEVIHAGADTRPLAGGIRTEAAARTLDDLEFVTGAPARSSTTDRRDDLEPPAGITARRDDNPR